MKNQINIYENMDHLNKAKPVYDVLAQCATKEEVELLLPYINQAIRLAKAKFGISKTYTKKTETSNSL